MASLPPPGAPIDPETYRLGREDVRSGPFFEKLSARTAEVKRDDPRLPAEVRRLEPVFVWVTPDAMHIELCGAGLACSVNAVRAGLGKAAFAHLAGGEPDCATIIEDLWYCHE